MKINMDVDMSEQSLDSPYNQDKADPILADCVAENRLLLEKVINLDQKVTHLSIQAKQVVKLEKKLRFLTQQNRQERKCVHEKESMHQTRERTYKRQQKAIRIEESYTYRLGSIVVDFKAAPWRFLLSIWNLIQLVFDVITGRGHLKAELKVHSTQFDPSINWRAKIEKLLASKQYRSGKTILKPFLVLFRKV